MDDWQGRSSLRSAPASRDDRVRMPETVPMAVKPRRRGPSRLVIGVTAVSLVVGVAAVAVILLVGPLMQSTVIDRARAMGVEMTFDGLHFWWFNASLEGVRFKLVGVPGID